MRLATGLLFTVVFALTACGPDLPEEVQAAMASLPERVDFNQHIRPILSDRCWSCHGPDAEARQAGLRMDTEAGAFATLASGHAAFHAGKPGSSEAVARMVSDDPETIMPPPESKLTVTPKEIALIAKWVEQGAKWKDHWAWLPIENPTLPDRPAGYAEAGSIDRFVNARLQQEGLLANERADDERLLRRVYLDLTGLPPGPAEMDAWLADPSDKAYEQLVDGLLQTDAHAERLTMEWLDLARYADSHGMHADGERLSHPYRDWIIRAYKDNKPFDAFVKEQVAGDLLPGASQSQKVASAFNRMHPQTAEGGVIIEEMRLSYVFDRVNTVATGILGLTMDCSRCHDHKFDPLSQAEYYGFSAFFNNFRELGMTGDDGDFGPYLLLADEKQSKILADYTSQLDALKDERAGLAVSGDELKAFLASERVRAPQPQYHAPLDRFRPVEGGQRAANVWAANDLSIVDDPERGRVAEWDHAYDDIYFDGGIWAHGATDPRSAFLYVRTHQRDSSKLQTILTNAGWKNDGWQGMEFFLDSENRLNLWLVRTLPDDLIHVRTQDSLRVGEWNHLGFSYDGSGSAAGIKLYVNGLQPEQHVLLDRLRGETYAANKESWKPDRFRKLRLGRAYRTASGEDGIFKGRMDEVRLYDRALTPLEVLRVHQPEAKPESAIAEEHLFRSSPEYKDLLARVRKVKAKQLAIQDTLPRLMVSEDMPQARRTYRLDRGAYDAPAEEVFPTTPAAVLPFPEDFPQDRAGLAEWIFLPEQPLTARVAVNRYWQMIFGRGIVGTPHDFGSQGELPTHPALLDHLATEFRDSGWDVRALLRKMVLSEAYRRGSTATPEHREADSENLLLARGPSRRLPAEMIRDNALAASGLLNEQVGGKSVKPYQPKGLWFEALNFSDRLLHYEADSGDDLYRRSMYTFIRRTVPPPFMLNFDATGRDVCVVKRSQTNTPLQALNLLNDPQFVETARVLAQRVQEEKTGPKAQIAHAFRLVTGRRAKEEEVTVLQQLYREEVQRFEMTPDSARALLAVGEYPVPDQLDPIKTAALASVGNVLFSFDEAYVKR